MEKLLYFAGFLGQLITVSFFLLILKSLCGVEFVKFIVLIALVYSCCVVLIAIISAFENKDDKKVCPPSEQD